VKTQGGGKVRMSYQSSLFGRISEALEREEDWVRPIRKATGAGGSVCKPRVTKTWREGHGRLMTLGISVGVERRGQIAEDSLQAPLQGAEAVKKRVTRG